MRSMTLALAALTGAVLLAAGPGSTPVYTFSSVKGKVILERGAVETRVSAGATGLPGDQVRTGWRGHATVEVPERAARFEILPSTRARLGGPDPGVLLLVERGRLKAFFDALAGHDERVVATPGALLAVRGTRYGIEVDGSGNAIVAVFEGAVEIRPRAPGGEPLLLRAGQAGAFGPSRAPERLPLGQPMTERSWDRERPRPPERSPGPAMRPEPQAPPGPRGGTSGPGKGGGAQ